MIACATTLSSGLNSRLVFEVSEEGKKQANKRYFISWKAVEASSNVFPRMTARITRNWKK